MQIPAYKGNPLAAITPLGKKDTESGQIWVHASLWGSMEQGHTLDYTLDTISSLVADGWQQIPKDLAVAAITQLYDVVRLATSDKHVVERWYKVDHDTSVPAPVSLGFSIPDHLDDTTVYMLNPFPVPQLGEYAYVQAAADDDTLVPYYIMDLPLEARQKWVTLGDKLQELSSPLAWPGFTEEHIIASDETTYHRHIGSLTTQIEIALGTTKNELMLQALQLQTAHLNIEQLRQMLSKKTLLQQWREVQSMAQDLAHDYYLYHQSRVSNAPPPTIVTPAEVSSEDALSTSLFPPDLINKLTIEQSVNPDKKKKPKGTPRPRKEVTPIVAKGKESISHNSNVINWEIINSLRDKNTYTHYKDYNLAEHKHTFMKNQGQILITISAQEGEGWETVLNALNTLGDGCIDTYIAVMAIAIEKNGVEGDRLRMSIIVNPDDILAICGKEKSHGSYTPFQRAEVIKHLKTLSQARMIVTMPGRPARKKRNGKMDEGTVLRAEGSLIDLLSFKIGEYHTITGEEVWERRSISVGPWATMMPGLSIQTATMFRNLLAYSSKNQRYQKRIGLYLTQMFRVNAKRGGKFKDGITMAKLLEGSGIVAPREQGAFRTSLEKAIQQLKDEGIIGDYWLEVDSNPNAEEQALAIQQHARGWFNYYLQQKWNFSPPESVKEQYRNLLKEPDKQD